MRRSFALLVPALLVVGCATGENGVRPRDNDAGRVDGGPRLDAASPDVCTPACAPGIVCRSGLCIAPEDDEDDDGVPALRDCDDADPTVGAEAERLCSSACGEGLTLCTEGTWTECDAPLECECAAGSEPRTLSCERCGTQRQVCTAGTWVNEGGCAGAGACASGEIEMGGACGSCGRLERRCTTACAWGDFTCIGGGECMAGASETRTSACGACGEGTRTDTRTCSGTCGWGGWTSGSCTTSATCAPGATDSETRACTGGCGGTQTRTRSCNTTTCTWGAFGAWSSTCPTCGPVCGNGVCESGETCSSCADCRYGHGGTASGTSCAGVPSETWRCVFSSSLGGNVSQVCRSGSWVNFNFNPRDCPSCVCSFSTACCQVGSPSSGC